MVSKFLFSTQLRILVSASSGIISFVEIIDTRRIIPFNERRVTYNVSLPSSFLPGAWLRTQLHGVYVYSHVVLRTLSLIDAPAVD